MLRAAEIFPEFLRFVLPFFVIINWYQFDITNWYHLMVSISCHVDFGSSSSDMYLEGRCLAERSFRLVRFRYRVVCPGSGVVFLVRYSVSSTEGCMEIDRYLSHRSHFGSRYHIRLMRLASLFASSSPRAHRSQISSGCVRSSLSSVVLSNLVSFFRQWHLRWAVGCGRGSQAIDPFVSSG